MNRLQNEKSPYLQMHSENPVDWYPWGEEAFARARKLDRPVFLSIGYSSCHWCHVIAHESFEDEAVAAALNESYVSVKVDKEERPDVDAVYMDAVQLATGAGGWPMTLLLTPEGEPFFAATYLPKQARGGMPGLTDLLRSAARMWRERREEALADAAELTRRMRALAARSSGEAEPSAALCEQAVRAYSQVYDEAWGGFGGAPKFPPSTGLLFLLRHAERTGDKRALAMAEGTLDAMLRGGLFDHVGGGFCRYSVDRRWLIPHFEKMLYDNALLLWAYAEGWRVTRRPAYRDAALRTADYALREMALPEGAFCCSQDADSEGREGAFYGFTPEEVRAALGREDGEAFCRRYGITPEGNFEGASLPNLIGRPLAEDERMSALRGKLYDFRRERMPLGRDDKVLTSWNALMIVALCASARALDRPDHLEAARRTERFLSGRLSGPTGGPLLRWRDGEAKGEGVLADYAYLTLALTALHAVTEEPAYLDKARRLAELTLERFGGEEGLCLYSSESERLITRPRETWDSPMPSGNACAGLALLRLAAREDGGRWQAAADRQLRFLAGAAQVSPIGHGFSLLTLEEALQIGG